jgi:hypothetical protein
MTGVSDRSPTRRKFLTLGAAVASLGAASIAGCGGATDDDAGRKGVEWFENELGRIGYVHGSGETWAIPPRKLSVAIQGDQLEAEIRGIAVTGTRPTFLDAKAQDQAITWRGQVYLKYAARERYHRNGVALEWSAWNDVASVLNVERRGGQWYVQRVR